MNRRAQNSLELIFLFSFLVIVFIGFSVVIQGKIREQRVLNQQALYTQLADKIEKEVLLASHVNVGYMRAFELPSNLGAEAYTVTLEDTMTLVINSSSGGEYLRFLSVNVTPQTPPFPIRLMSPAVLELTDSGVILRNDCLTGLIGCI